MSFSTTLTEILVYILPQQTYQQITKTIHTFFVYIYTFIIEPSAIRSIKLGLTFGIILASLLDFFPGCHNNKHFKTNNTSTIIGDDDSTEGKKSAAKVDNQKSNSIRASYDNIKDRMIERSEVEDGPISKVLNDNNEKQLNHQQKQSKIGEGSSSIVINNDKLDNVNESRTMQSKSKSNKNDFEWAGDNIHPQKIELLRTKLGLTNEQMQNVIRKSQREWESSHNDSYGWNYSKTNHNINDGMTITQKVNVIVYSSLIVMLVYFINRDYDNVATIWFVRMFPKESRMLGIDDFLK